MNDLTKQLLAGLGTAIVAMAAQYIGVTAPAQESRIANRDANWAARDALEDCRDRNAELRCEIGIESACEPPVPPSAVEVTR